MTTELTELLFEDSAFSCVGKGGRAGAVCSGDGERAVVLEAEDLSCPAAQRVPFVMKDTTVVGAMNHLKDATLLGGGRVDEVWVGGAVGVYEFAVAPETLNGLTELG